MTKTLEKNFSKLHYENVELKKEIEGLKKVIEVLHKSYREDLHATTLKYNYMKNVNTFLNQIINQRGKK